MQSLSSFAAPCGNFDSTFTKTDWMLSKSKRVGSAKLRLQVKNQSRSALAASPAIFASPSAQAFSIAGSLRHFSVCRINVRAFRRTWKFALLVSSLSNSSKGISLAFGISAFSASLETLAFASDKNPVSFVMQPSTSSLPIAYTAA